MGLSPRELHVGGDLEDSQNVRPNPVGTVRIGQRCANQRVDLRDRLAPPQHVSVADVIDPKAGARVGGTSYQQWDYKEETRVARAE